MKLHRNPKEPYMFWPRRFGYNDRVGPNPAGCLIVESSRPNEGYVLGDWRSDHFRYPECSAASQP